MTSDITPSGAGGLTGQHPNPGYLADAPEIIIRAVREHRV
jgi:hypothetical protein